MKIVIQMQKTYILKLNQERAFRTNDVVKTYWNTLTVICTLQMICPCAITHSHMNADISTNCWIGGKSLIFIRECPGNNIQAEMLSSFDGYFITRSHLFKDKWNVRYRLMIPCLRWTCSLDRCHITRPTPWRLCCQGHTCWLQQS